MTYKRSNAQKVNVISQKKFQIYSGLSMRSKTDKCKYLRGPTQKFFNFFFIGLHTSSMNGFFKNWKRLVIFLLKSQFTQCAEKATTFCKIFTLLLPVCTVVKSKVKISQNFVAFSEYMNFIQNGAKCFFFEVASEF